MAETAARPFAQGRTSAALFLAGFATFSLIYCTQPLLPHFAAEFRVSPAASSLALSLTTLCLAFSILIMGALSESFGRRGLMFLSMAAAALLNLAVAGATSWRLLLAIRALEGMVLGGVPAVAMAYLAEEAPPGRLSRVMGLYIGGTALGGMAGRMATGALTHALSWRAALAIMASTDLLAAAGFVLLLPPSRHFVRRRAIALRTHLLSWHGHIRHRALPGVFATGFLAMGTFVTVYNYITFRLVAPPYSLNAGQLGLIFLAYLFGMVASPVAGGLAERLGRSTVVRAGGAVTLLGLACTALSPLPAVIAGITLVTIGFFVVHAVASGWVGFLARTDRSYAASLYLLSYYLGSSIMGSLGGLVWHAAGWGGIIAFCAVQTALVLGIAWRLRPRAPHSAPA